MLALLIPFLIVANTGMIDEGAEDEDSARSTMTSSSFGGVNDDMLYSKHWIEYS
jgi:hypothetical protein